MYVQVMYVQVRLTGVHPISGSPFCSWHLLVASARYLIAKMGLCEDVCGEIEGMPLHWRP